jgi:ABC-type antimicrobial peptide transport system permease subunit
VLAFGLNPSTASYLSFTVGGFYTPENPGVIITAAMAEKGGYQLGDELSLVSQVTSETKTFPIVGIFDGTALMAGLGGGQTGGEASAGGLAAIPSDFIGIPWLDLTALDGATVKSDPRPQIYFANTPESKPDSKKLDDEINRMSELVAKNGIPMFSLNFVDLTNQISDGFFTIQAILSAVAGLIALVGALGLLTTLSMSVFERQKEIGVMRSIGAGSSTVATQFLTEGLVVGFVSWVVGLPLMVLVQFALLQIIGAELFPLQISGAAIVIGLVGMILITIVASLWPSLGAARKTVSDILRYQ